MSVVGIIPKSTRIITTLYNYVDIQVKKYSDFEVMLLTIFVYAGLQSAITMEHFMEKGLDTFGMVWIARIHQVTSVTASIRFGIARSVTMGMMLV